MAINLVVNAVTYSFPEAGDAAGWGANVTNWAQAVTSSMLQKSGGTFTLSAVVDFGASYGLKSIAYTSRTANPASAGVVQLANADTIKWRNSGNSADIALTPGSSDTVLSYAAIDLANISGTQTLTNKTISGSSNTLSAIAYSSLVLTGAVVNADVSASAAIAYSKLAALTSANILVGNGSNVATVVAVSGDLTLANTGAFTVAKINGTVVSGTTGSGNVVFSASPTLSGTVAGSITLSGAITFSAAATALTVTNNALISGNLTVSGTLTGTASGNTTYTANQYGVVLSGATNAMSVLAPDASTAKALISGGASANPSWGVLSIAGGGSGQVTQTAAFNALSPGTTKGDILVHNGTNVVRVGIGSDTQVLTVDSSQSSGLKWANTAAATAPTFQKFQCNTTGDAFYTFTVTAANATAGATYTNSGHTYTVIYTIAGGTTLVARCAAGSPAASGTLTKSGGTGDATIAYSAFAANGTYIRPSSPTPLYIRLRMVAGGAGGSGSGTAAIGAGGNGGNSTFGTFTAHGGTGGSGGTPGAGGTGSAQPSNGFAVDGGGGGGGDNQTGANQTCAGATGGNSYFGAGARGAGYSEQGGGGTGGFHAGGGGGGAGDNNVVGAQAGNGGGAGEYLETLITSPSSAYTFSVGLAGTFGAAGTSGLAGGPGMTGMVMVEEYYQ